MTMFFANLALFCGLPMELLTASVLFALPLQHRSRFALRTILYFCVIVVFGCVQILFISLLGKDSNSLLFTLVFSASSFAFCGVYFRLSCTLSITEIIYSTTAAYLTQHMTYCVHAILEPGLNITVDSYYTPCYFAVHIIVYGAVYFAIAKPLAKHRHYDVDIKLSLSALLGTLVIALVLSSLVQQNIEVDNPLYRLCLCYDIFCCLFALISQCSQQKQLALRHELDTQHELWLTHKRQYEKAAESVEIINHKYHDLKHQVAAINLMLSKRQDGKEIPKIEIPSAYDAMIHSGNQILDTILTEKSLICDSKGYIFTCAADGECLSFVDTVDLYTMLGNALDNAIEGVSELKDDTQKMISVNIYPKSGLAVIEIENYYAGSIELQRDGFPVTRKDDKHYHGFGLRSIRRTAEKYSGTVTIRTNDSIFRLTITMPECEVLGY